MTHLHFANPTHSDRQHETVWLGRGGQGAFTAARLLGLSAVRFAGQQAVAFPSFGPERRGAPVFAYTRISATPVTDRSAVRHANAAVILDESLLCQVPTPFLHDDTLVIVDAMASAASTKPVRGRVHRFDTRSIAREVLGTEHTNTVLLGFFVGISGLLPAEHVEAGIAAEFGTGARGHKNVLAFRRAWALGQAQAKA